MDDKNDKSYDEMKDLRLKTFNEKMSVKFKKNFLGGLKENEVEEYITSLQQEFNQTEQIYRDRFDEFATFTEMLTKEKEDALEQIRNLSDEINQIKSEMAAIKEENAELLKTDNANKNLLATINKKEAEIAAIQVEKAGLIKAGNENKDLREMIAGKEAEIAAIQAEKSELMELETENKALIEKIDRKEAEIANILAEKMELLKIDKENKALNEEIKKLREQNKVAEAGMVSANEFNIVKRELTEVCKLRDKLAGENAVLKKQLEGADNLVSTYLKEKNEIKDSITTIRATIRQSEMKKNLALSEYTEKQVYTLNQATQNLKNVMTAVETMKNEVNELYAEMKETKIALTAQNDPLNKSDIIISNT